MRHCTTARVRFVSVLGTGDARGRWALGTGFGAPAEESAHAGGSVPARKPGLRAARALS